ncbi:MAG: ATP-dependent DNA helicase [Candidatus Cloacimonetes bacterium]|nr:ATP-dependent DNA helicase [Candidatus Cloacimonadota bacterium]
MRSLRRESEISATDMKSEISATGWRYMSNYHLTISVREIIESVFLCGDLQLSFSGNNRLLTGSEAHREIQQNRKDESWENEKYVKYEYISNVMKSEISATGRNAYMRSLRRKSEISATDMKSEISATGKAFPDKENEVNRGLLVHGRIDGVYQSADVVIIEEIKSFIGQVEFKTFRLSDFIEPESWSSNIELYSAYQSKFQGLSFLHWGQALLYSYIYLKQNGLKELLCRVHYTLVNSEKQKGKKTGSGSIHKPEQSQLFEVLCSGQFLELFFVYTCEKWLAEHGRYSEIKALGKASLIGLEFPYKFRFEQRKMAVAVYKNISKGTNLYSRAPTGTGKTLATLYPALKALGEEKTEKIFYLTAKTVGRKVAESSIQLMQNKGADIRYCVLTAKEKACLKEFPLCDPDFCEYAVEYYRKQKEGFLEALNYKNWDAEQIRSLSKKYKLCPFEFSLYLSQFAEIVICDYNYAFDPIIYIRRHFDNLQHSYTFLIDEAHNLPDRAREMYSREITNEIMGEWIREFPNKKILIYKKLLEMNIILKNLSPLDKSFFILPEYPEKVIELVETIIRLIEEKLCNASDKKSNLKKPYNRYYMIKIYFQLLFLLGAIRSITDEHIIYYQRELVYKESDQGGTHTCVPYEGGTHTCVPYEKYNLKIFCLNPKKIFSEYLKFAKSAVFFSATLHPFDYFCEILAEKENDNRLSLLSPFEKDKFGLYVYTGINTLYQYRDESYQPLAELIYHICNIKNGNYLIYFPSFAFLNLVYEKISYYMSEVIRNPHQILNIVCQKPNMTENQRDEFLSLFEDTKNSKIGFAVLGGIFGEGIDLIGSKLIGCIIVTVGLPALGGEKDLIKDYYDIEKHKGFDYAYRLPGFNKIMQAAGRVIRSESDKGIVVLIDKRFMRADYIEIYPKDWEHYRVFSQKERLVSDVRRFWEKL